MLNPKRFLSINTATLVSVFVLILVGGIVRGLGAGMGCPDWPKCFGEYIPPSSAIDLPSSYQEQFLKERVRKNERLANTLEGLGFKALALKVRGDQHILKTEPFDVRKAWIEYVNRLVGVLIGLFIFVHLLISFSLRKENKWVPILSGFLLVLTAFQGWVGSLVVSTNLLPGFITFHMSLALLMVAVLILVRSMVQKQETYMVTARVKWVLGLFFILLIPQIIFGTLTREQVDILLDAGVDRANVASELMGSFFVHRSYSWLLLIAALASFFLLRKNGVYHWAKVLLGIVAAEIIIGVLLVYVFMSPILQPLHLLLGTLLFAAVFYLFLRLQTVKG